jgi:hypothetical protein
MFISPTTHHARSDPRSQMSRAQSHRRRSSRPATRWPVRSTKPAWLARSLVGHKGYVTNRHISVMPAAEVIAKYHDLWHVERSFRMSKPIWTPGPFLTAYATPRIPSRHHPD